MRGDIAEVAPDRTDEPDDNRAGRYEFIRIEDCRSDKVRALLAYWDKLRGERLMPRREEVDATEIWPLLKNVFMTEWHREPDRLYYRIAGTELVASMGFEIRGKWLTDLYQEQVDIDRTLGLYRRVVDTRAPAFGRTEGTHMRHGAEGYDWVICPLSADGEMVTHFIGLEDYVARRRYLGGMV